MLSLEPAACLRANNRSLPALSLESNRIIDHIPFLCTASERMGERKRERERKQSHHVVP